MLPCTAREPPILRALSRADALTGRTRPLWQWIGQIGVVVLGVHLVADRLDDAIARALYATPIPWPAVAMPETLGAWGAVALELMALVIAADALVLTPRAPRLALADWWSKRSIEAFALPLFWAACAAAGAWSVGMSTEDWLAARAPAVASAGGPLVALAVGWRLGWTGWRRIVGGLVEEPPWHRGWGRALVLLPVATAAIARGLPIWGWL